MAPVTVPGSVRAAAAGRGRSDSDSGGLGIPAGIVSWSHTMLWTAGAGSAARAFKFSLSCAGDS